MSVPLPKQVRAGRALLDWSQSALAAAAGVSLSTVKDFEAGRREPVQVNMAAIRTALEAAGVIFVAENGEGAGVRLRKKGLASVPLPPVAPTAAALEKRRVGPEDEARSGPEVKDKPARQMDD